MAAAQPRLAGRGAVVVLVEGVCGVLGAGMAAARPGLAGAASVGGVALLAMAMGAVLLGLAEPVPVCVLARLGKAGLSGVRPGKARLEPEEGLLGKLRVAEVRRDKLAAWLVRCRVAVRQDR